MLRPVPKPEKPLVSPVLRKSARDRRCSLRWAKGCTDAPGAVVLCHIRGVWSGGSQKPDDTFAIFACTPCNAAMASANRPPGEDLLRALNETQRQWLAEGLLRVGGK